MEEQQAPVSSPQTPEEKMKSLTTVTHAVYALQAINFLLGVTAIAGVIINYVKRDEVKGTWLESHFTWQIRTFWYGLLWAVIGVILMMIAIGVLVLLADTIWIIYRIVKGWLRLNDKRPAYDEPPAQQPPAQQPPTQAQS